MTTREAFDALVQRRVLALSERGDPNRSPAARQEAQLLEAAATEFADAVDRSEKPLAYEDAVVLTGSSGVVVVSETEWRATPVYCEALAGEVETLTQGGILLRWLQDGTGDSPAS